MTNKLTSKYLTKSTPERQTDGWMDGEIDEWVKGEKTDRQKETS